MRTSRFRWRSALATVLLILEIGAFGFAAWEELRDPSSDASGAVWVISFLAFPIVGWLIAVKLPRNPLAWIYLTFPIVIALGALLQEPPLLELVGNEGVAAVLSSIGSWAFTAGLWLVAVPGVLLFPNGQHLGSRWRWAFWGSAILLATLILIGLFGSEKVCIGWSAEVWNECVVTVENPLNLSSLGGVRQDIEPLTNVLLLVSAIVSLASLVRRYRRSSREVGQQIKWVALVAVVSVLPFGVLGTVQSVLDFTVSEWVELIPFIFFDVGIPISIAVAIFKYRLYDIDRIISRTASYAIVVSVLAAVFVASVTLTQRLLPIESQFGIVVSTLVVAALFNPLRQRVQRVVDRRFNRSTYDAQRILDELAVRLRNDVDLEHMQAALLSAAREAMQPTHLSL